MPMVYHMNKINLKKPCYSHRPRRLPVVVLYVYVL